MSCLPVLLNAPYIAPFETVLTYYLYTAHTQESLLKPSLLKKVALVPEAAVFLIVSYETLFNRL